MMMMMMVHYEVLEKGNC